MSVASPILCIAQVYPSRSGDFPQSPTRRVMDVPLHDAVSAGPRLCRISHVVRGRPNRAHHHSLPCLGEAKSLYARRSREMPTLVSYVKLRTESHQSLFGSAVRRSRAYRIQALAKLCIFSSRGARFLHLPRETPSTTHQSFSIRLSGCCPVAILRRVLGLLASAIIGLVS